MPIEAEKVCDATIMHGENCQDETIIRGMRDGDRVVIINVRDTLEETVSYCGFIVNATANARTVIVEAGNANLLGKSYCNNVIIPPAVYNNLISIFQRYLSLIPAVIT
jgi:hypothetical protein